MKSNIIGNVVRKNEFISLMMCLLLVFILSMGSNIFWSTDNINSLQTSIAPTVIVAIGMMLLLICGVFDLSVGAIMGFIGIMCSNMLAAGLPVPVVIILGLLIGAFIGCINGLLVSVLEINPLIATIGMQFVVYGFAMILMSGIYQQSSNFPESFIRLGAGKFLGIYYMFWIMLFLLVILTLFLRYVPGGRRLYFVGGNRDAARQMGFNSKRIVFLAYMFTGFLSALSGILSVARYENANRYLGDGMQMTVIIGCILGGGSLAGGKGSVIGALFGVTIMSLLTNTFNLFNVQSQWQSVVVGIILILVILSDGYLTLKKLREVGKI